VNSVSLYNDNIYLHEYNVRLHLMCGSLGPRESTSQTASRSVQPFFAQLTTKGLSGFAATQRCLRSQQSTTGL